ncbi:MAG: alpha/beta hydrolase [Deltaproteobacteria bacterium]|nr:alpha/beta hydrolase [Candidatus Anaeroferrophillus wilburensis]MBN2887897.1 alpha/beta hydrolase [Deltaproteobacteria bacterium]
MLSLWGCAGLSPCPSATADKLAEHAGLQKQFIQSGNFELLTYSRTTAPGAALTIYIEGDGSAWRTRRCLSSDPTPKNPVALKLALLDPAENVVYLARPCQYVIKAGKGNNCSTGYWSTKIFSPPVIEAINQACSIMKKQAGAREIHLVGYSGGGAVAVLTAARRDDILSIRTIAGNLDHQEVCRQHHISPLIGSLNAIDAAEVIKNIPQIHFSGSRDRIIPPAIVKRFIARQTEPRCSKIVLVRNVDHHKGWQEQWPTLLRMPLPCTLPTPDRE